MQVFQDQQMKKIAELTKKHQSARKRQQWLQRNCELYLTKHLETVYRKYVEDQVINVQNKH